jgi:phenylpropionate dioxygenase-like ring-hydroxylating dioxygenase large terminal subunit
MPQQTEADEGYNGLTRAEPTLPSSWYLDAQHYQTELDRIWYRQWIYVDRASALSEPGSYRLLNIGKQQVIILRDESGQLQAFHNTCRHRGALLLTEASGQLRNAITCPYHAWSYSLQGDLQRTPSNFCQQDFDPANFSLYNIAVEDWRGFIFINLDPDAGSVTSGMDAGGENLRNWPLEELEVGYSLRKEMRCNWKIFWENFNECLHCPGVHPELSELVPLYRRRMMEVKDDPNWQENSQSDEPKLQAGLSGDGQTWSSDGQPCDTAFAGLSEEDLARGHTYEVLLPSVFIVGHMDYVRLVQLKPLSEERTEISAQWLFRKETLARPEFNAAEFSAFAEMVMLQDAHACELNQKGLQSIRHEQGTLMAEEYDVFNFQQWVRQKLD